MKKIELKHTTKPTLYAIVDDDDFYRLNKHTWRQQHEQFGVNVYAVRGVGVMMHREVMRAEDGVTYDHINRVGLDNRKVNLRKCRPDQNGANKKKKEGKTTPFGVHLNHGKYRAEITVLGKGLKLEAQKTPKEAAYMYDWMARIIHGDFARQNFSEKKSYTI